MILTSGTDIKYAVDFEAGTISEAIYKLTHDLQERFDIEVILFADLGPHAQGRCSYEQRTLSLDCCEAMDALLTLAHEAGHWIHHLRDSKFEDVSDQRHEHKAYLYGWGVLHYQKLDRYISKEQWREFHAVELGVTSHAGA